MVDGRRLGHGLDGAPRVRRQACKSVCALDVGGGLGFRSTGQCAGSGGRSLRSSSAVAGLNPTKTGLPTPLRMATASFRVESFGNLATIHCT